MTGVSSWLSGTAGLWVVLVVSTIISGFRPLSVLSVRQRRDFAVVGLAACTAQAAHFTEEFFTGFSSAFPVALGLSPWSQWSFAAFNVVWIFIWVVCVREAPRGHRIAEFPLWFLALALLMNGIAHPLLALREGGYFPGLATSILAGAAGVVLLRCLLWLSHPKAIAANA
jgi:hypothetical protein